MPTHTPKPDDSTLPTVPLRSVIAAVSPRSVVAGASLRSLVSMVSISIALVAGLAAPPVASASDIAPQPDNGISAHDVRTGKIQWTNDVVEVGNTHLVLRDDGLEVIDWMGDKKSRLGLDPADGSRLDAVPSGTEIERSVARWPRTTPTLSNGWTIPSFSPGNDKQIEVVDESGRVAWTIDLGDYAHSLAASGERVFVAKDYLADDAVVRAWRVGDDDPEWRFDLNASEGLPNRQLRRVTLWPVGDELLLVQSHVHIFALDTDDGSLEWHIDATKATGLKEQDFYVHWGIPHASVTLARDEEPGDGADDGGEGGADDGGEDGADDGGETGVIVVAWDRQVAVFSLDDQDLLWTLEPDSDPHAPEPLVHDGVVYLSSGSGRSVTRP